MTDKERELIPTVLQLCIIDCVVIVTFRYTALLVNLGSLERGGKDRERTQDNKTSSHHY